MYVIIYFKTDSLLTPILMHIIGNFVGSIGINFILNNLHDYNISIVIAIVIAIVSFIWIMKINSNNKFKCSSSMKE